AADRGLVPGGGQDGAPDGHRAETLPVRAKGTRMQRSSIFGVVAVLSLTVIATYLFTRGAAAPPPAAPAPVTEPVAAPPAVPAGRESGQPADVADAGVRREVAPMAGALATLDPELRAALTGFKGRVVDHGKQ